MIALVRIEIVVFLLAHETLLKREVRGNALEQVAEKGLDGILSRVRGQFVIKSVDQINQLAMFVIDSLYANAVLIIPLQQSHQFASSAALVQ
jgi:hypothetical protein